MCTVVVRFTPGLPTQVLALRDELTSRRFDDPDFWWDDYPGVVGGRDRTAGGTWCASRVTTGATALVLNRLEKRVAAPEAPSRGLLPLLGVRHETTWQSHVDVRGMASFLLVLSQPDRLLSWRYDGQRCEPAEHDPGTHMFTSGGAEDGKADRYLAAFARQQRPDEWRALVAGAQPTDDPAALVVRHEQDGLVFATVFGQLISATPGRLRLDYSRQLGTGEEWTRFETDST